MFVRKKLPGLILVLTFVLSACAGPVSGSGANQAQMPATTETMMEKPVPSATPDAMMGGEQEGSMASTEIPGAMMGSPEFFSTTLTEATTGQSFTLSDFQGKVVLVETMAVWCTNCFQQQEQIKALHDQLGERQDFVSVSLDIDPNEDTQILKSYVEKNGFNWTYAVALPEVAREIGQRYGAQFLNPPSTPIFIIDRHGQVHLLPFGIKSAASLKEALDPFLSEGM